MKYKDYYEILGVARTATTQEIKKAYRKLAHQYHPDVSKNPQGEEKFKEIAEAYATLKNPETRQEYDDLGQRRAGEDFTPPPDWQQHYGQAGQYGAEDTRFEDVDLADLFKAFRSGGFASSAGPRERHPVPGEDYSVHVSVSLEQVYSGSEIDLAVEMAEYDGSDHLPRRVPRTFRVNIPKGATEGQRLRLAGKGGPGRYGGPAGDLYLVLSIAPHPRYRLSGRDLYFDLPLAPWEAALGAAIEIPTLGGKLELKVKPGTSSGQRLRLAKRGLPAPQGDAGDLYAVAQIVIPKPITEEARQLYQQLAAMSDANVRDQIWQEAK